MIFLHNDVAAQHEYSISNQTTTFSWFRFTISLSSISIFTSSLHWRHLELIEEEIDLIIEDYGKMNRILSLLGFKEVLSVKKERELFKFDYKNYSIEALIDYLPILDQHFIEVEYLTDSSEKIEEIKDELFDFLSLFNIKKEDSVRKSYLELVIDKLKD